METTQSSITNNYLTPSQIKILYTRAAEILRKHGWIQGNDFRLNQGYCALGALDSAGCTLFAHCPNNELQPLRSIIDGSSITAWNDHPDRTKAEVIAALEAVANQIPTSPVPTPSPLTQGDPS